MASQFSSDSFAGALPNQTNLAVKVSFASDRLKTPVYDLDPTPPKSIVALKAASEIFLILGDTNRSQHYDVGHLILLYRGCGLICPLQSVATSFLTQWQTVALSLDKSHYTLSYRNDPSYVSSESADFHGFDVTVRWSLLYNLYADRLLGLNVFPPSVYQTREFFCARTVLLRFKHLNHRDEVVRN
jgi:hypothetical protein